jgi:hypothetical protein
METNFQSELANYVNKNDNANANRVINRELANALIKERENFIEVLQQANINVPQSATDTELVDLFVANAPTNNALLLNASMLVNHLNQTTNFDGEQEISDAGVKTVYREMKNYFSGCEEEPKSNWVGAALGLASAGAGLTSTAIQAKQKKKYGVSESAEKQAEARRQILQQLIAKKQADAEVQAKKDKQKNTLLIVGVGVVGLVIVVGLIVYLKKKNN